LCIKEAKTRIFQVSNKDNEETESIKKMSSAKQHHWTHY